MICFRGSISEFGSVTESIATGIGGPVRGARCSTAGITKSGGAATTGVAGPGCRVACMTCIVTKLSRVTNLMTNGVTEQEVVTVCECVCVCVCVCACVRARATAWAT